MTRLEQISKYISEIEGVKVSIPFIEETPAKTINGQVLIEENGVILPFEVSIFPQYPFQFHDTETIKFFNSTLIEYNHVMADNSICIHTIHSSDLKDKLIFDFSSLKQWINKYYIHKEAEDHYEHIIVPNQQYKNTNFHFLFTDVVYQFNKGDFGFFDFSLLAVGKHLEVVQNTCIIQAFKISKTIIPCKWSAGYLNLSKGQGIFVYIESPPVRQKRFIISNWSDLESFVDQRSISFIFDCLKKVIRSKDSMPIPLLIGYKIPNGELHWQCAAIDVTKMPIYSQKIPGTKNYEGHFYNIPILWLQTRNCSYEYFFGRGTLDKKLTDTKILIIGIGAVGSILATTLTRCGAISIALADYDVKEPENVCRSEYLFATGINSKVFDLKQTLIQISPFINVSILDVMTDAIKSIVNYNTYNEEIKKALDEYDVIFDCSADNDLTYILENLALNTEIINLSITNYAKELVCVVKPNIYEDMKHIFGLLLPKGQIDLYTPTGCWSPTFRASYNDISVMVQSAIKQINQSYKNNLPLRNFYLQSDNNGLNENIKMHQF